MRHLKVLLKPVKNSRGLISAEFIFSLAICVGMIIILFSLNFSLSMAEVAQYIAFSAARAHAAGHLDQDQQEKMAKDKFNEFLTNSVLQPLFNNPDNGWFKLTGLDIRGGGATGKSFQNDYPSQKDRAPQVGVRFNFSPQLLNLKIAFLGSTTDDNTSNGFSAKVTGFLIREPTQKECWEQIKIRYSTILNLDPRYKRIPPDVTKYNPMEDNGC
ncbi:MAG: hypothetical protein ACXVCY_11670 [Pseudobdellovibrionaceae bacterium]